MTTSRNVETLIAFDLFQRNEVVVLPWVGADPPPKLAAIETVLRAGAGEDRSKLIWACVDHACNRIARNLPSHRLWLCASDCGANNRITRHRALWKGLATRGFAPLHQHTPELAVEIGDDSICFYGAAELEREKVADLHKIVTPASRSFLAWMPSATVPDVAGMVAAGWNRGLSELRELAKIAQVLSQQGGVILRLFGEFDDTEAGVDCIMDTENCTILSAVEQDISTASRNKD